MKRVNLHKAITFSSFFLIFIIISIFMSSVHAQKFDPTKKLLDLPCDYNHPCPYPYTCYYFPDIEMRCGMQDPCDYYECPEGTECKILESQQLLVLRVHCKCTGENCDKPKKGSVKKEESDKKDIKPKSNKKEK